MFESICILGRQKGLSLAELESLFGAEAVKPVGESAALLNKPVEDIPFKRLGGTLKLAKTLTELPYTDWKSLEKYLVDNVPKHLSYRPEGKVKFGISVYGLKTSPKSINATGLKVKKAARDAGRSMRVIPNDSPELKSAQVLRNKLTAELGIELLYIKNGNKTILAQTIKVQDIDAYAARDQARPARDARVGMLPPKLAQIILNLAIGSQNPHKKEVHVLDPFCGTGVILQEALLMGCFAMGSDIDQKMILSTKENIHWLHKTIGYDGVLLTLEVADATDYDWISTFGTIACETYLGRPFSAEPDPSKLKEVIHSVNTIHKKFLQNVATHTNVVTELKHGREFRMCIAVPAWHTKNGIKHLPVLDHLTDMGYTRMSFVHAADDELIYHREGQIVGRELVVLIRK